ncbi:MAG: 1-deoxy-D-xylulose-5-phosphate synthase [Deltaproteobacteria bacterium]|nr:1-deoxy-D-xylulose-5-phosphate synthase [Deltaproteobacteria bacterium]
MTTKLHPDSPTGPKGGIQPTLTAITRPQMLNDFTLSELTDLAPILRETIIRTVSATGGHLAPSLGTVELTLALLKVFDPGQDRIIWDVGHQAYSYKLLTGRADRFHTLRQAGGISGFPKICESPFDHFGVGHSSTSISAALGMAVARDQLFQTHSVVAVIGDGSMTAGLAYEGLNQAGDLGKDLLVVLNDNEMSISKNVGALSSFLSRHLTNRWVVRLKKETENFMRQIPKIGDDLAEYVQKGEDSLKSFFTPGMLFEAFKFTYLGPIDGHDIKDMIRVLERARELEGPVLVHVLTKKGKGYEPAEMNPTYYHGVGCFEPETGTAAKFSPGESLSYTEVFGSTLCALAERNDRITAITAAMPEGTGLSEFARRYPSRFFDVGICEQHAVTFAAGLAREGFKPVVSIYSTFLQRSYDQVVHDVCTQNLPVVFCLDRGGLVGEDGPTHHGAFDLSYLRHIPNIKIMAPADEAELRVMLVTALSMSCPVAIRYPRGCGQGLPLTEDPEPIPVGRGLVLRQGPDAMVVALGSCVQPALDAVKDLAENTDLDIGLLNARWVKPLPEKDLKAIAASHNRILVVEENVLAGGFGSAVLEFLSDHGLMSGLTVRRLGLPDEFVEHGPQKWLRAKWGLNKDGIKAKLVDLCTPKQGDAP